MAIGMVKNILPWSFRNIFIVLEGGYHNKIMECVESLIVGINVGALPCKGGFDHSMSAG